MTGLGTAINVGTVVGGTTVGLVAGGRLPERVRSTMLHAVGLAVIAFGVADAIDTHNVVFPLVAVVLGALIGELARIEDGLERVGDAIRRRVEKASSTTGNRFVEGFVDASLLYCVGPLAILGSIADGLHGDIKLLVLKAALDGIVSIVFAASLGWGVGFSAIPVLLYQGTLTLLASQADSVLTDRMVVEMTATGGLMVIAIGLRLLDLTPIRVGSLLPALVIAPVVVALFAR